jgi:septal ring factor EnvC (AmiA/AmiB activator)
MSSSQRFKKEIKPMGNASEAILALKPVSFQYKNDKANTAQFGLVAEDVAKVNPDLMVRDKEGKPYTVRYDQVNAMLLNEFLKEHSKNEERGTIITQQRKDFEAAIAQQQREIEALTATVKQQAAQIQKVSAQLEAGKPAPQVVNNP